MFDKRRLRRRWNRPSRPRTRINSDCPLVNRNCAAKRTFKVSLAHQTIRDCEPLREYKFFHYRGPRDPHDGGGLYLLQSVDVSATYRLSNDGTPADPLEATRALSELGKAITRNREIIEESADCILQNATVVTSNGPACRRQTSLRIVEVDPGETWHPLPENFERAIQIVSRYADQCILGDTAELSCVHIHPDYVEASDNFRLARYVLTTGFPQSKLIRAEFIKNIVSKNMTEFRETQDWIRFRNPDGAMVSCRTYDHPTEYPDLTDVIDKPGQSLHLPHGIHKAALRAQRFAVPSIGEPALITMVLRSGRLEVRSQNPQCAYRKEFDVEYTGDTLEFLMDPDDVIEITKRNHECQIGPGWIRVSDGDCVYAFAVGDVG